MIRTTRRMFALGALALLAGCADSNQKPPQNVVPIGEFKLGHTIVVAKHAQKDHLSSKDSKISGFLKKLV